MERWLGVYPEDQIEDLTKVDDSTEQSHGSYPPRQLAANAPKN